MTDAEFTPKERELIRSEFMERFGGARAARDGILVKRWATGPNKGQPKPMAAVQTMIDRGLLSLADDGKHWLTAHFTPAGWRALKTMAQDARLLPADRYERLHAELKAVDDDDQASAA